MKQVEEQTPELGTANVRTAGPKATMLGVPERCPATLQRGPYLEFVRALVLGTGRVAGAPTNLRIVGFETN